MAEKTFSINVPGNVLSTAWYTAIMPQTLDKIAAVFMRQRFLFTGTVLDDAVKEMYLRAFVPDRAGTFIFRDKGFLGLVHDNVDSKELVIEGTGSFVIDISGMTAANSFPSDSNFRTVGIFSDPSAVQDPDNRFFRVGCIGSNTSLVFEDGLTTKTINCPVMPLPSPSFSVTAGYGWGMGFNMATFSAAQPIIIQLIPGRRTLTFETTGNSSVSTVSGTFSVDAPFIDDVDSLLFTAGQFSATQEVVEALPSFPETVSAFTFGLLAGSPDVFQIDVPAQARCQIIVQPNNLISEPEVINNVLNVPRSTAMPDPNQFFRANIVRNGNPDPNVDQIVMPMSRFELDAGAAELKALYPPVQDPAGGYFFARNGWTGWGHQIACTITKPGCADIRTFGTIGLPYFDKEALYLSVEETNPTVFFEMDGINLPSPDTEPTLLSPTLTNFDRELTANTENPEGFRDRLYVNNFLDYDIKLFISKVAFQSTAPGGGEESAYCTGGPNSLAVARNDISIGALVGTQTRLTGLVGPVNDFDIIDIGLPVEVRLLPEVSGITGWTIDWNAVVGTFQEGSNFAIAVAGSSAILDTFFASDFPLNVGRRFYNDPDIIIQAVTFNDTEVGSFSNLVLEPTTETNCALIGGALVDAGERPVWTGEDHDEFECQLADAGCCGCQLPLDDPEISFSTNGVRATINRGTNVTGVVNNLIEVLEEEFQYMIDKVEGVGLQRDLDMNQQRITNVGPAERPRDLVTLAQAQEVLNAQLND